MSAPGFATRGLTGKQVAAPGQTNQSYDAVRRHRITQAGGLSYGYDADGNVTQRGTQQLRYDPLNRVTSIGPQTFAYGADGLRLAGGGGGPLRIFVGDLFEWQPATGKATARIFALGRQIATKTIQSASLRTGIEIQGTPIEWFLPPIFGAMLTVLLAILGMLLFKGGIVRGMRLRPAYGTLGLGMSILIATPPSAWAGFGAPPGQGTYRRWIWQDPLGTAVYVTDDAGLAIHERAFDPFGGVAAERSSEVTERTFAGHNFEEGSGLYYMRARWYDPAAGRFLSTDPLVRSLSAPQSMNAYSYVENNPINRIDPNGTDAVDPRSVEEIEVFGRTEGQGGSGGFVEGGSFVTGGGGGGIDRGIYDSLEFGTGLGASDLRSREDRIKVDPKAEVIYVVGKKPNPNRQRPGFGRSAREVIDLDRFLDFRGSFSESDLRNDSGFLLGPIFRYVREPQDPSLYIDMRHFLMIGPVGTFAGGVVETFQFGFFGQGFQTEDLYSNRRGAEFFRSDFYDSSRTEEFTGQVERFLRTVPIPESYR